MRCSSPPTMCTAAEHAICRGRKRRRCDAMTSIDQRQFVRSFVGRLDIVRSALLRSSLRSARKFDFRRRSRALQRSRSALIAIGFASAAAEAGRADRRRSHRRSFPDSVGPSPPLNCLPLRRKHLSSLNAGAPSPTLLRHRS